MSKKKDIRMTRLFCLNQLILEDLDELKPTTPIMVKYRETMIKLAEEMNNVTANTLTIQKSTYFQELTKKVDTVIRKNFEDDK